MKDVRGRHCEGTDHYPVGEEDLCWLVVWSFRDKMWRVGWVERSCVGMQGLGWMMGG